MDDYWSVIESEQQITDQGVRHDFLMEGDDYNNNNSGIKDEHDGGDDYNNNNSGIKDEHDGGDNNLSYDI